MIGLAVGGPYYRYELPPWNSPPQTPTPAKGKVGVWNSKLGVDTTRAVCPFFPLAALAVGADFRLVSTSPRDYR